VWPEDDELHYWTLRYLLAYIAPAYRLARQAVMRLVADSPVRHFDREIEATAEFLDSDEVFDFGLDSAAALAEFESAVVRAGQPGR
jgi:hypothetical protein